MRSCWKRLSLLCFVFSPGDVFIDVYINHYGHIHTFVVFRFFAFVIHPNNEMNKLKPVFMYLIVRCSLSTKNVEKNAVYGLVMVYGTVHPFCWTDSPI